MHQISHGNISFLPLKNGIYTEFYCTSQIIEHRMMPNVVWLETTCFLKFLHQISHGNISFLPLKNGIYTEFYCTSQIIEHRTMPNVVWLETTCFLKFMHQLFSWKHKQFLH